MQTLKLNQKETLILNTNEEIIKYKVGLLNPEEEWGNVSPGCQAMGLTRDTLYLHKAAIDEGGIDARLDHSRPKPNHKNRAENATEQAVILHGNFIKVK